VGIAGADIGAAQVDHGQALRPVAVLGIHGRDDEGRDDELHRAGLVAGEGFDARLILGAVPDPAGALEASPVVARTDSGQRVGVEWRGSIDRPGIDGVKRSQDRRAARRRQGDLGRERGGDGRRSVDQPRSGLVDAVDRRRHPGAGDVASGKKRVRHQAVDPAGGGGDRRARVDLGGTLAVMVLPALPAPRQESAAELVEALVDGAGGASR